MILLTLNFYRALIFTAVVTALFFIVYPAQASGGISVSGTRFIYPDNATQLNVEVSNSSDADSYLIQSWVSDASGGKSRDFVVTPPLYLAKPQSKNVLRLIHTGGPLPRDRETLFYLTVKAIPSIDDSNDRERAVIHIAAATQLKMFFRPQGLPLPREGAQDKLSFIRSGSQFTVHNPTPYYLTLTRLVSGGHALPDGMVAPGGNLVLPKPAGSHITYQTISDYGGLTAARTVAIR